MRSKHIDEETCSASWTTVKSRLMTFVFRDGLNSKKAAILQKYIDRTEDVLSFGLESAILFTITNLFVINHNSDDMVTHSIIIKYIVERFKNVNPNDATVQHQTK